LSAIIGLLICQNDALMTGDGKQNVHYVSDATLRAPADDARRWPDNRLCIFALNAQTET